MRPAFSHAPSAPTPPARRACRRLRTQRRARARVAGTMPAEIDPRLIDKDPLPKIGDHLERATDSPLTSGEGEKQHRVALPKRCWSVKRIRLAGTCFAP